MNEATSPSLLDNLRQQGADRFDPVRFHYLASFEQRLLARGLQEGVHWQKLERAVAEYQARLNSTEQPKQATTTSETSAISVLLKRLNQTTETSIEDPRSPLEQRVFGEVPEHKHSGSGSGSPTPLKAMTRVQADHGVHALQERIRRAIESTPKEAGPMNAHRQVSRAMAEMQRLSPEYLERFARYTDTLMALERMAKKG